MSSLHRACFIVSLLCCYCSSMASCISYDKLRELNLHFAVRLYQTLVNMENRTNLVVSPSSVASSLGLLQFGAQGNTFAQMESILGYNVHDVTVQDFMETMFSGLANSSQGTAIHLACALFIQTGTTFSPRFIQYAALWANSSLQLANFSEPGMTATQINQWVSSNTGGEYPQYLVPISCPYAHEAHYILLYLARLRVYKLYLQLIIICQMALTCGIQPLVPCDEFGPVFPQIALVSTMYFKSTWKTKFSFTDTQTLPFISTDGSTIKVPMMHQTADVNYGQFETPSLKRFTVVELPYIGNTVSMFVVRPSDRNTPLSCIEANLTSKSMAQWANSMKRMKMDVFLPRFRLQSHSNLRNVLPALGATDLFDPWKANFKGISEQSGLYISQAIHKAEIEVAEGGTRASGVTAMVLLKRSRMPVFKADRPFFFFLRQASSGSILFIGRVTNPLE
ncbi:serpin E3 [Xenopus tropicalis]|uniref:Serpin E3 n=1 Tax=Xenopus tropicalis TaxID=8364 RepID=A0A8J1J510_XENTR|nr:serpin E3 [Xenopus tropicalis]